MRRLLSQKTVAIAEKWFDRVVETYPRDAARLLRRTGDRFANPVGSTLAAGLREIVEGLAQSAELPAFTAPLDRIVRIRAIQDFSASQAVAFVFDLKDVLRGELSQELADPALARQLAELEGRIDQLALLAFDVYAVCRERVAQIRVDETKRRVAQLMKESGKFILDPSEPAGSDSIPGDPQQGGVR